MDLFKIGDRVRTTAEAPPVPAGMVGTVTSIHARGNAHGVLLDADPSGQSAYYHRSELEAE